MPAHYPEDRLYHRDALWLQIQAGDEALLGISYFAQQNLGEVVFLDLPQVGAAIRQGTPLGTIESHKIVSDLIAPVDGCVLAVNPRLRGEPGLVNSDPYGEGWVLRIRLAEAAETGHLLEAGSYLKHIGLAA